MSTFTATAGPSLALIKYFGKADDARNLPATPSLGVTVVGLGSEARVEARAEAAPDQLWLDGAPAALPTLARAVRLWDALRDMAGGRRGFEARVVNHLPSAAGLASSSSSFAALARASVRALGLALSDPEVAAVARLGSGSAARACFAGWSALETDGRAFAVRTDVAVELVAVVVEPGPKSVPSAVAMQRARATSPLYADWLELGRFHFDAALEALAERDVGHLFALAEANSRLMHEVLATSVLSIDYATPRTREALAVLERLRRDWAFPLAVSRDAGPNPFVVVEAGQGATVAEALRRALPAATVHLLSE